MYTVHVLMRDERKKQARSKMYMYMYKMYMYIRIDLSVFVGYSSKSCASPHVTVMGYVVTCVLLQ